MYLPTGSELVEQIRKMHAERAAHIEAISRIDRVLSNVNAAMAASLSKRTSSNTGTVAVADESEIVDTSRKRGRFALTAEESVLQFIKARGNPSTADLTEHWRAEGRKGAVNVTLYKLLLAGQITRVHDAAVRGSRYAIAGEQKAGSVARRRASV